MKQRAQIDIFIDGVKNYFSHFEESLDALEVGTPYLVQNSDKLGLDFTGAISISGSNRGQVFFTSTRSLLKYILLRYGESNFDEQFLSDLVGEVANTISGNARSRLGAEFHISTPRVIVGEIEKRILEDGGRSYVLPIRWKNNVAQLIVSLEN